MKFRPKFFNSFCSVVSTQLERLVYPEAEQEELLNFGLNYHIQGKYNKIKI